MKPFPPTLREKRRYIEFQVFGEADEKEVTKAINRSILGLFGEDGYSRANVSFVEYSGGRGILKCAHNWLGNILIALAFVTQIRAKPARIEATGVSGTLKSLKEK